MAGIASALCASPALAEGDSAKGAKTAQHLTPEMLLSLARMGESSLSPDGKQVAYALSFPSIEENKSRSELFLVGMDGKGHHQLTNTKHNEYSPTWIEGGKRIAYMSNESGSMQVWTMMADGSDKRQITDVEDGIEGFSYSPDGRKLLYIAPIKYGKRASDLYPDLPKATGRVVNDLMYKHWDEWVESIPHIFYATLDGATPIKQGKDILEGEPYEAPMRPHSGIEDVAWTPDSRAIAYASRKKEGKAYTLSTNSDIYLYNLESGQTRNLTEGMMGYDQCPSFSPDGRYLAWTSMERDGYEADLKRLFVLDMQTGERKHINPDFEYDVDALQWSANGKSIYFLSCVKAETNIFEIPLKTQKVRQITSGQHNYTSFQIEQGQMLAGRQSMLAPTDLYKVNLKTGQAEALTQVNENVLGKLEAPKVEKRWVKTTDGGDMLVWVVYPPHFDPTKQYPSLLYCQGGPQSTISQYFSYRWNARLMAEQGYIVIMPNRHGVPSFGKKWNEQISGDYSGQNIRDYLTAVDEMKKEAYINSKAIGAVGASYGGYSVYYLAGHHEGRFSAFIAHAGIFNLEMQYMTTEEMWFANWDMGGAPWDKDNKTAQRTFANSPHKFVGRWDTPILVIHGEKDFRIMAEQGQAAFNAAQLRGIPSQMLIYPDENHWILRPQNALLWQRTFFAWLDRWLKK